MENQTIRWSPHRWTWTSSGMAGVVPLHLGEERLVGGWVGGWVGDVPVVALLGIDHIIQLGNDGLAGPEVAEVEAGGDLDGALSRVLEYYQLVGPEPFDALSGWVGG